MCKLFYAHKNWLIISSRRARKKNHPAQGIAHLFQHFVVRESNSVEQRNKNLLITSTYYFFFPFPFSISSFLISSDHFNYISTWLCFFHQNWKDVTKWKSMKQIFTYFIHMLGWNCNPGFGFINYHNSYIIKNLKGVKVTWFQLIG